MENCDQDKNNNVDSNFESFLQDTWGQWLEASGLAGGVFGRGRVVNQKGGLRGVLEGGGGTVVELNSHLQHHEDIEDLL